VTESPPSKTAEFANGVVRAEGRLFSDSDGSRKRHVIFGAEALRGEALGGDVPRGNTVVGGRLIGGVVWH
jgi:hypothetical protein